MENKSVNYGAILWLKESKKGNLSGKTKSDIKIKAGTWITVFQGSHPRICCDLDNVEISNVQKDNVEISNVQKDDDAPF